MNSVLPISAFSDNLFMEKVLVRDYYTIIQTIFVCMFDFFLNNQLNYQAPVSLVLAFYRGSEHIFGEFI